MKSTGDIEIRKHCKTDENDIRSLIEKVLKEEFPEESAAYSSEDLSDLSGSYGKLGEAFFVAVHKGKVIGTVGVKQEDERTALLRRLFVDEDSRKRQLGARLADRAISFAREVGYDELIFKTTSSMKDAVRLGEKKGFAVKARLNLGSVELVKFSLRLKSEATT